MREITLEEAESVVGAYGVPGAIAGRAAGAVGYVGTLIGGGSFNGGEFAAAVGTGALGGAVFGPVGIGRTLGNAGLSFTSGAILSNANRLANGS